MKQTLRIRCARFQQRRSRRLDARQGLLTLSS